MKKRGQLKLSFGMIFSIILIIVFLVFAFYAIKMILNFQQSASIGKFVNDFQNDIDEKWANTGSQVITYNLVKDVEQVCFDQEARVSFKPLGVGGEFDYTEIEHLEVEENFCINNIDGKIKIKIKRDESVLVSVEEVE